MKDNLGNLLFAAGGDSLGTLPPYPKIEVASKLPNYFIRAAQMGTSGVLEELGRSVNQINSAFVASNIPSLMSVVNVYSNNAHPALQVSKLPRSTRVAVQFLETNANPI